MPGLNIELLTRKSHLTGTEKKTGRVVAIKKIRIGQFKDGLDLSAIREVKTLQELRHENIIEVNFGR